MRYRNKPELQDKLAAEYVLGTLRGRARQRFQSWMREDASLRREVEAWESRLGPLADAVRERQPPARVWRAIQARIGAPTKVRAKVQAPTLWNSVAFWRGWGLVATGCTAALVTALALRAPQVVEIPVVQKIEVESRTQPAYVAVLRATSGKGEQLAFVAYARRDSDELSVKRLDLPSEPAQRSYELWGLPRVAGSPPRSLGVIPQGEKSTLKLPSSAEKTLADFPALAISLEPEGGSKTGLPTGPVIASGNLVQL